jgi:hypothetical protein
MLDATINDEAVTCVNLEDLASDVNTDSSADNIDELVVRVAVTRANPISVEVVADEHQLVGVGEYLAAHARFGREGLGFVVANDAHDVSRTPSVLVWKRKKCGRTDNVVRPHFSCRVYCCDVCG